MSNIDEQETTPFLTSLSSPQQKSEENPSNAAITPLQPPKKVSLCSKIIFSLPALSLEALHVFHHTWVTKYFVDDIGYPPLSFAVFHATERSFGIVTYPFIGLLVDRTVLPRRCHGCSGRRRLFFYIWPVLLFVAYLLIWSVPSQLAIEDPYTNFTSVTDLLNTNTNATLPPPTTYIIEPRYFGFITITYLCGQFLKNLVPVDLPWMSLAAEATNNGVDRTELYATKSVVGAVGLALGSIGPIWLLSGGSISHFQAFSKFVVIAGIFLVVSFWFLALHVVPAHQTKRKNVIEKQQKKNKVGAATIASSNSVQQCDTCCDAELHENGDVAGSSRQTRFPFVAGIILCFDNGPYMRLWLCHAIVSCGDVLHEGMFPFFVQYVLQPSNYETWVSVLMCIGFACSLIATPIWMWISGEGIRSSSREEIIRIGARPLTNQDYISVPKEWNENQNNFCDNAIQHRQSCYSFIDKRKVWLGGWLFNIPINILAYLLAVPGNIAIFCVAATWTGLIYGGTRFLSRPIRADCIDYDQLRTGLRREGAYVMTMEILPHFLRIPATAFSLSLLTNAGYVAHATQQNDQVKATLCLVMFVIPFFFSVIAWLVAYTYPIHDVVHHRIVDSISKLNDGAESVIEPITGGVVKNRDVFQKNTSTTTNDIQTTTRTLDRNEKLKIEAKEFAMDSFLLSTVKSSDRKNIVGREKLRCIVFTICVAIGIICYCSFVNVRSLTQIEDKKGKPLLTGHHEMHTVGSVVLTSGCLLLAIFFQLRLKQAVVLKDMDEETLQKYVTRKGEMNGTKSDANIN